MNSARDEKKELRKSCALLRDSMPKDEKTAADRRILRLLTSLSSYRFASALLLYAPIKSEIDVWPLAQAALDSGKVLALPLCEKESGVMTFRTVSNLSALKKGSFGVMEPPEDAPLRPDAVLRDKNALLVVPALAFDKKGYRLGYGKGYYDRFLARFGGVTVGLVYRDLLFDHLPKGYYDRKVKLIISESGVILTSD